MYEPRLSRSEVLKGSLRGLSQLPVKGRQTVKLCLSTFWFLGLKINVFLFKGQSMRLHKHLTGMRNSIVPDPGFNSWRVMPMSVAFPK